MEELNNFIFSKNKKYFRKFNLNNLNNILIQMKKGVFVTIFNIIQ